MPNHEDMPDMLGRFFRKAGHVERVLANAFGSGGTGNLNHGDDRRFIHADLCSARCFECDSYFQAVTADILRGLDCKVWGDHVLYFEDTEDALLQLLDKMLECLESVGMFVTTHKCASFSREFEWFGTVYSDSTVSQDPVCVQGL